MLIDRRHAPNFWHRISRCGKTTLSPPREAPLVYWHLQIWAKFHWSLVFSLQTGCRQRPSPLPAPDFLSEIWSNYVSEFDLFGTHHVSINCSTACCSSSTVADQGSLMLPPTLAPRRCGCFVIAIFSNTISYTAIQLVQSLFIHFLFIAKTL